MIQTEKQYPLITSDNCYLYILATGEMQYYIGMAGNPKLGDNIIYEKSKGGVQAAKLMPAKLVYYRCFEDTLSALGFKLLLEKLAPASVDRIIRRMNPTKQDLSHLLQNNNNRHLNNF